MRRGVLWMEGRPRPAMEPPTVRPGAPREEPVARASPTAEGLPLLIRPTPLLRETAPALLPPREKPPRLPPERTCATRLPSQIRQPTSNRPAAFREIDTSSSVAPLNRVTPNRTADKWISAHFGGGGLRPRSRRSGGSRRLAEEKGGGWASSNGIVERNNAQFSPPDGRST